MEVKDVRPLTEMRSANTTQLGQVAMREHNNMSESQLRGLHAWLNSKYWCKEDVIQAQALKNRRLQLFPLLPVFVKDATPSKKYLKHAMKRVKLRGYGVPRRSFRVPWTSTILSAAT